jgi:peptidoglycan/LPS O-acetylase OafA/YrhL
MKGAEVAEPAGGHARVPVLDGLRGLAVILVLLVHFSAGAHHNPILALFFRVSGAGWLGVDLFFVLSGFLITGILLRARSSAHYFRNFYARRVLRIFPLYYGVLVLVLVGASAVLGRRVESPSHLWMWLYGGSIYPVWFNGWPEFPNVLGVELRHFWSLAIEEHFYLVWPWLVWRSSRRTLMRLCVCLFASSLALRILMVARGLDWGAAYAFTPARLDSLSVGAFLAVLTSQGGVAAARLAPAARRVLPVAALGLVVCSALSRDSNWVHVPMLTVGISFAGVFFGALLVLAITAPATSPLARALGGRFLGFFGKYSYGIYVYSGALIPIFEKGVFSTANVDRHVHSYFASLLICLSVTTVISAALALVSWNLFEKQFLKLKRLFEDGAAVSAAEAPAPALRVQVADASERPGLSNL